jgi:hypothetical protein
MSTWSDQARRSLPQRVLDALDDLYEPDRQEQWLERYALTGCRRRRETMVALAIMQAEGQTV